MKKTFTLLFALVAMTAHAQFLQGNVLVSRLGDGTTALGANTAPVSLLEFSTTDLTGAPNMVPRTTVSLNATTEFARLTLSGTTGGEGQLALSQNGTYVSVLGYDQPVGIGTTAARSGRKVIARINSSGVVEYNSFDFGAGGAARNAVSVDGSSFWLKVSNTAVGVYSWVQPSTPPVLISTPPVATDFASATTVRNLFISKSQLYEITSGGSLSYSTPALPTGTGVTSAAAFTAPTNPLGFVFFDMDPSVSWNSTGFDLVYIAGQGSGLEKWYFNGTAWIAANTGSTAPTQALFHDGAATSTIAGTLVNGVPTLYCISGNGAATNNKLYVFRDQSGSRTTTMTLGGAGNTVGTSLATAGTNYAFRGVSFTPGTQVVIPLDLMSFKGSLINNKAALQWSTASERNVKEFVVEKSGDAKTFAAIGKVAAKNGSAITDYAFDDEKLAENVNYYRLKMVDNDGTFKYSNIVAIKVGTTKNGGVSVFPNPVSSTLTISHTAAEEGAIIRIVSLNGSTVAQYAVSKDATQTSVDASQLVAGQYFINFISKSKTVTTSFVK